MQFDGVAIYYACHTDDSLSQGTSSAQSQEHRQDSTQDRLSSRYVDTAKC